MVKTIRTTVLCMHRQGNKKISKKLWKIRFNWVTPSPSWFTALPFRMLFTSKPLASKTPIVFRLNGKIISHLTERKQYEIIPLYRFSTDLEMLMPKPFLLSLNLTLNSLSFCSAKCCRRIMFHLLLAHHTFFINLYF